MSPEEKRARRLERDRAAYARDPEKYRALAREDRRKPCAAERHKEYAKAWALRNAERVTALRKANYEKDRQINIEMARVWKKRNPARVLASQRSRATIKDGGGDGGRLADRDGGHDRPTDSGDALDAEQGALVRLPRRRAAARVKRRRG
jgi:hypothetical protein